MISELFDNNVSASTSVDFNTFKVRRKFRVPAIPEAFTILLEQLIVVIVGIKFFS